MNATGKESCKYDNEELKKLAEETASPRFPAWVRRGLLDQVDDSAQ
jgi:hypothetical protein